MWTWLATVGVFPAATGAIGVVYFSDLIPFWGRWDPVGRCLCVLWAGVGLIAGTRSVQVCVMATPDHLIIRNFFFTRRIPWTQISAIERPRPFRDFGRESGLYNGGNGLRVLLTDGKILVTSAFSPSGYDPPGFADPVIAELRKHIPSQGRPTGRRTARPQDRFQADEKAWYARTPWQARALDRWYMFLWVFCVPVLLLFAIPMTVPSIGPAWSAKFGEGTPGTFTATSVECNRSCTWTGEFFADDRSVYRTSVSLGEGGDVHRVGQQVPAVDTGDRKRVFPPGGGWDWLLISFALILELVCTAFWVRWAFRRIRGVQQRLAGRLARR
jgi:hypothetical protein